MEGVPLLDLKNQDGQDLTKVLVYSSKEASR
jgi:hypothetical protein